MGCCASTQPPPKPSEKAKPPSPDANKTSMKSYATKTEKPMQDYHKTSVPLVNEDNEADKIEQNDQKPEPNTSDISIEEKIEPIANKPKESNIPKPKTNDSNDVIAPITIITPNSAIFSGLYDIFTKHATGDQSDRMDIDGLTSALKIFGLKIDKNKNLQKLIWSKFDLENEKEIDYNDFMATMSSLIDSKNDDSLFLFFQIFDYDENGFLEVDELAEMIFSQQKIAAAVTNQPALITSRTNQECLSKAQQFVAENDENGDGKISFEEYDQWRNQHHIATPIQS